MNGAGRVVETGAPGHIYFILSELDMVMFNENTWRIAVIGKHHDRMTRREVKDGI